MSIEIIPVYRWPVFLKNFSTVHKTSSINIEILTFTEHNGFIEKKLKLIEIKLNKSGNESTTIITGERPGAEITEFISMVKNIFLEKDKNGTDKTLFINSIKEGTVAINFS